MKITIVGAGNMGLALTGYLATKGKDDIVLYTTKTILEKGDLILNDIEENKSFKTRNFAVTFSIEEALKDADIILCTYPAFLRKKFVCEAGKYLKKGTMLGFVPGYGGIEYCCDDLIKKGVIVFGFQRVPYVARASDSNEGYIANIVSKKKKLYVASIPRSKKEYVAVCIESLLDIETIALKEYLSVTLVPSNPLLHISGLYTVFKNYEKGDLYNNELKFYEEWSDETSELLLKYDDELQQICLKLNPLDLEEIVSLRKYYEAYTYKAMTQKLKSIKAFNCVMVPLKKEGSGFVPDLNSRMFVEDFPYGVCIIKAFAIMAKVETETIDMLLEFYKKLTGICYYDNDKIAKDIKDTGVPILNDLDSIEKIVEFYHQEYREG